MLMPRGGVGVAGLGGYLYAVGGNDGAASLQSVERYNPHTNKWSRVAPMNRRRAGVTHSTSSFFSFFVFMSVHSFALFILLALYLLPVHVFYIAIV